jgi:hypothetical protein
MKALAALILGALVMGGGSPAVERGDVLTGGVKLIPHLNPKIYVPMQGPSELGASGKLEKWDRTAELPAQRQPYGDVRRPEGLLRRPHPLRARRGCGTLPGEVAPQLNNGVLPASAWPWRHPGSRPRVPAA